MTMTMPDIRPGSGLDKSAAHPAAAQSHARPRMQTHVGATVRDRRLDVFRGMAMFIILIAHTPGNFLTLWIPARFGFSDATEIFVFCSGMASAIAFGRVFDARGWMMGTARVAHRCWQVYWAHIGLFFTVAMMLAVIDGSGLFEKTYISGLNLTRFFNDTGPQLIGLMTLTYVPNYFDILPMYLVVLAMMPVVMAISRVNLWLVALFVFTVWLGANLDYLRLPAEPWSNREWFFNPFGWQLVFFTGFAFMRGWLPKPPVDRRLLILAAVIVLVTIPFAYFRILNTVPELRDMSNAIKVFKEKTDFGILRYVHFLALAYLAWSAAGHEGWRLAPKGEGMGARIMRPVVATIEKVGQQSLAVFIFSMVAARFLGFVMDQAGRSTPVVVLVNLTGFAMLIAVAHTAAWFKSHPWRRKV